jgi:plasmid stabilization system protein ParE
VKFRFLTPASAELDDAVVFYEAQRRGLGHEFAAAVERTLSRVALFPDGYPQIGLYSRRCLVPRFPYGVIYQLRKSDALVLVVAVALLHGRPDYWKPRES